VRLWSSAYPKNRQRIRCNVYAVSYTLGSYRIDEMSTGCALPSGARAKGERNGQDEDSIGVVHTSVRRWEQARNFPRPVALVAWADRLGCTISLEEVADR